MRASDIGLLESFVGLLRAPLDIFMDFKFFGVPLLVWIVLPTVISILVAFLKGKK